MCCGAQLKVREAQSLCHSVTGSVLKAAGLMVLHGWIEKPTAFITEHLLPQKRHVPLCALILPMPLVHADTNNSGLFVNQEWAQRPALQRSPTEAPLNRRHMTQRESHDGLLNEYHPRDGLQAGCEFLCAVLRSPFPNKGTVHRRGGSP